mmetsp:Transcript_4241/g.6898  ORF Transcript_4241/g.6898 Transcript_4241/m.6898 type:complete len:520 (-) Transcript_4241:63-1622(-)
MTQMPIRCTFILLLLLIELPSLWAEASVDISQDYDAPPRSFLSMLSSEQAMARRLEEPVYFGLKWWEWMWVIIGTLLACACLVVGGMCGTLFLGFDCVLLSCCGGSGEEDDKKERHHHHRHHSREVSEDEAFMAEEEESEEEDDEEYERERRRRKKEKKERKQKRREAEDAEEGRKERKHKRRDADDDEVEPSGCCGARQKERKERKERRRDKDDEQWGSVEMERPFWKNAECPACGAKYMEGASYCHVCKRMRDVADPIPRDNRYERGSSPDGGEREKSKKFKKERRERRRVSPNGSVYSYRGSPYSTEHEQRQEQGTYDKYADAYYSEPERPRLPEYGYYSGQRSDGPGQPAYGYSGAYGAETVPLPTFPNAHDHTGRSLGRSPSPPSRTGSIKAYQSSSTPLQSEDYGPRVLETVVHEPVRKTQGHPLVSPASSGFASALMSSSYVSSGHASTLSLQGALAEAARPKFVGEVVHEPVIPERLGEVVSGNFAQSVVSVPYQSYQASYDARTPKMLIL